MVAVAGLAGGARLFLLRPLLAARRAALRDWLRALGEPWIDDPANLDPRFARARARAGLAAEGLSQTGAVALAADAPLALAGDCRFDFAGGVSFSRAVFRDAPAAEAQRLLALACVCAGGGARLPASAARDRLAERLRGNEPVVASLAGARVEARVDEVRIDREAGEARRGGLQPLALTPGQPVVWDGRYEIAAAHAGLEVRALQGLARGLPADQQRALAALPAPTRAALPALVDPAGAVSCPLLGASSARVAILVEARLRAAAGLTAGETRDGL